MSVYRRLHGDTVRHHAAHTSAGGHLVIVYVIHYTVIHIIVIVVEILINLESRGSQHISSTVYVSPTCVRDIQFLFRILFRIIN